MRSLLVSVKGSYSRKYALGPNREPQDEIAALVPLGLKLLQPSSYLRKKAPPRWQCREIKELGP